MSKLLGKYFPKETYSEETIASNLANIFHAIVDKIGKTAEFIKDRKKVKRTLEEKLDLINGEWSDGSYLDNLTFKEGEVKYGGKFPINTIDKTKPIIDKIKKSLIPVSRENKILIKRRTKLLKDAIEYLSTDNVINPATTSDYRKTIMKNLGNSNNIARDNRNVIKSTLAIFKDQMIKGIPAFWFIPTTQVEEMGNNPYGLVMPDKTIDEFFGYPKAGQQKLLTRENFDDNVDFIKECVEIVTSFTEEQLKSWDNEVGDYFPITTFGEMHDYDNIIEIINKVFERPDLSKEAKTEVKKLVDEVIYRELRYFVAAIWGRYNRNLRYVEKTIDQYFRLCQSSYK